LNKIYTWYGRKFFIEAGGNSKNKQMREGAPVKGAQRD
jgi:hypothetical protein